MAGDWKAVNVALRIDGQQFEAGLRSAHQQLQQFGQQASGAGSAVGKGLSEAEGSASKLGSTVKGAAANFAAFVGAQLTVQGLQSAFAATVSELLTFDTNMRNVNSLAQLSEGQFGSLERQVLSLSKTLPQSASDLAAALYDLTSSGFGPANGGMVVLDQSAQSASAGLTTTANAAKGIASVLNAYGLQATDAAAVSNTLFQGVNDGVITFEELNGVIGDTAGISAAAGIPLKDMVGAVAAMTLSGISASEAGTSYTRVVQALIKPSEAMTDALHKAGYENGETALKTDGLQTVMGKLREQTGGSVTALLRLFPEVRGARGAFALLANEGKTYGKVMDDMGHAQDGVGAKAKALSQQMEGFQFQATLFANNLKAGFLEVGTQAIPILKDGLRQLQSVGEEIWPTIVSGAHLVGPALARIGDGFGQVVSGVGDVVSAMSPLLAVLGEGIFLGFVGGLQVVGGALQFVGGLISDHAAQVAMLVAAWVGFRVVVGGYALFNNLAAGLNSLRGVVAGAIMDFQQFRSTGASTMGALKQMMGEAGGGMSALGAGAGVAAIAFAGGMALVGAAVAASRKSFADGEASARKFVSGLHIDEKDIGSISRGADAIRQQVRSLNEEANNSNMEAFAQGINPFDRNTIEEARGNRKQLEDQLSGYEAKMQSYNSNVGSVSRQTGTDLRLVAEQAKSMGLDLTKGFSASGEERQKLLDGVNKLKMTLSATGVDLRDLAAHPEQLDATIAQMKELDQFAQKVGSSFAKAGDVVAGTSKSLGLDLGANNAAITKWYGDTITTLTDFGNNINKAISQGYNPGLISRMLQAGPEQAGPVLTSLVSDTTGSMVEIANKAEQQISKLTAQVVEQSRLVHQAELDPTSRKATDLPTASVIDQLGASGMRSVEIGAQLNLDPREIERIISEFGIQSIPISLDFTRALAGFATIRADFEAKVALPLNTPLRLQLHSEDAEARIKAANGLLEQWGGSSQQARMYVDSLDANAKFQLLDSWSKTWAATDTTATATLNTDALSQSLQTAFVDLSGFQTGHWQAYVGLNSDDVNVRLSTARQLIYDFVAQRPTSNLAVLLNNLPPDQAASLIDQMIQSIGARPPIIRPGVDPNSIAGVLGTIANLTQDARKLIYVDVVTNAASLAILGGHTNLHGGILAPDGQGGMVRAFAGGGMFPQIGQRGVMRVWNEPATGQEAYVPQRGDRERALTTLGTAAGWYGLAITDPKAAKSYEAGGLGGANLSGLAGLAGPKPGDPNAPGMVRAPRDGGYDRMPAMSTSSTFAPTVAVTVQGDGDETKIRDVVRSEVVPTLDRQYSDFVRMARRKEG